MKLSNKFDLYLVSKFVVSNLHGCFILIIHNFDVDSSNKFDY